MIRSVVGNREELATFKIEMMRAVEGLLGRHESPAAAPLDDNGGGGGGGGSSSSGGGGGDGDGGAGGRGSLRGPHPRAFSLPVVTRRHPISMASQHDRPASVGLDELAAEDEEDAHGQADSPQARPGAHADESSAEVVPRPSPSVASQSLARAGFTAVCRRERLTCCWRQSPKDDRVSCLK